MTIHGHQMMKAFTSFAHQSNNIFGNTNHLQLVLCNFKRYTPATKMSNCIKFPYPSGKFKAEATPWGLVFPLDVRIQSANPCCLEDDKGHCGWCCGSIMHDIATASLHYCIQMVQ